MSSVQSELQDDAKQRGWFAARAATGSCLFGLLGLVVLVVGILLTIGLALWSHAALLGIPVIIGGIALMVGANWIPHRTAKGYAIYRVESKSESAPKAFETVREEIGQKIFEGRVAGETQKYLARLRVQALIEWKDDAMKKAYEKALAERSAAK